jgi:NTE family protein
VTSDLALVLSGGGARAAYQVGCLRYLAAHYPDLAPGIITGVSAGGIIATHLAARSCPFGESVATLDAIWNALSIQRVFRVDTADLGSRAAKWGLRLLSGGIPGTPRARSLVDTAPLYELLTRELACDEAGSIPGIARSLDDGRLRALALTASSYTTGQSVTWVQAQGGAGMEIGWQRPQRTGIAGEVRVAHVMASAALPFFFPAIDVDGHWYGDGGIRLTAPLSPAVQLGATRILAVSTRYGRSPADVGRPAPYPPPAQVAGVLLGAIFLDLLDSDALRLQQVNGLLERLPANARGNMRRIEILVLRPSQDLGRLANEFEADLPRSFRFLVRGLGSRETRSNDMLSLVMFQQDYITRLIELGEQDARARGDEIAAFLQS